MIDTLNDIHEMISELVRGEDPECDCCECMDNPAPRKLTLRQELENQDTRLSDVGTDFYARMTAVNKEIRAINSKLGQRENFVTKSLTALSARIDSSDQAHATKSAKLDACAKRIKIHETALATHVPDFNVRINGLNRDLNRLSDETETLTDRVEKLENPKLDFVPFSHGLGKPIKSRIVPPDTKKVIIDRKVQRVMDDAEIKAEQKVRKMISEILGDFNTEIQSLASSLKRAHDVNQELKYEIQNLHSMNDREDE